MSKYTYEGQTLDSMKPENVISTIRKAARQQRVVYVTYRDAKGVITTRRTEPYEIRDGKYWGYCYLREGIRQFKLDTILSAKISEQNFIPRWPIKIS